MTVSPKPAVRRVSVRVSNPPLRLLALAALAFLLAAGAERKAAAATLTVAAGGDLQAAINAAQPGDTINVEAGATFVGSFLLPQKVGDAYVTIQSSRAGELPAAGQRVGPQHAPLMAKLASPGYNQPALWTAPGAHHYRVVGLEITLRDHNAFVSDLVTLAQGDNLQGTLAAVPHHLTLDRCYIHGLPGYHLKRGIALNSAHTEILGCYISEIHAAYFESQAICGWDGPGPFRIINNYVEGATENLMFGGADPTISGLVPSDIEIRRNHFFKPPSWRGVWLVKNLFELKNAQRVTIDGNIFENNWAGGQSGYAIVLTPRNESGRGPQSTVRDVRFTNNIVRNTTQFINILGSDYNYPSQLAERITIENNLLDGGTEGGGWFLMLSLRDGGPRDLHVEHNTVIQNGDVLYTTSDGSTETASGFVFRNNLTTGSLVYGDNNEGRGVHTLAQRFPGYVFQRNVLANPDGWASSLYPPDTALPPGVEQIGFTDTSAGNYRLLTTSPYKNAATDGKDIGCDFDQLAAALGGSSTPLPTPTPTPTPLPAAAGTAGGLITAGGVPVAGQRVVIYDGAGVDAIGAVSSDASGRYRFEVNQGQRVVIRPEGAHAYTPAQYAFTAAGGLGDFNFAAAGASPTPTPAPTPSPAPVPTPYPVQEGFVGGRVLSGSTPLAGHRVVIYDRWGDAVGARTTDAQGRYSFEVNSGQSVIIRPDAGAGGTFSPAQYAFTVAGGRTDLDFVTGTASPTPTPTPTPTTQQVYVMGGRVLSGSTPLAGHRVVIYDRWGDAVGARTTDAQGRYSFEVNSGQSVIVRPAPAAQVTFSPAQYSFTASAGRDDLNFSASGTVAVRPAGRVGGEHEAWSWDTPTRAAVFGRLFGDGLSGALPDIAEAWEGGDVRQSAGAARAASGAAAGLVEDHSPARRRAGAHFT